MSENISISVIIVTRNRANWLDEALRSLARQTRTPDEVIVVDNDSLDNTREVALRYNDTLNIKYFFESCRGVQYARNAGIENAKGDVIAFIDDDCEADKDWLKNIEKPFIKDPKIGVVGGEVSYLKIDKKNMIEEFYVKNMIARKAGK
jgi:glycosyltransferase involved in cell wall biosynthesis